MPDPYVFENRLYPTREDAEQAMIRQMEANRCPVCQGGGFWKTSRGTTLPCARCNPAWGTE